MLAYSVFLAFFYSAYFSLRHGCQETFYKVWIPIFLLIPFVFTAHIPMVPIRTFAQAAVVPLMLCLVLERRHQFRLGKLEWMIAAYVVLRVVADFQSRGYKDAQNYAFYMLSCLVAPYLMGYYLIGNRRLDIRAAKLLVLLFLCMFPMFLYEAKFWVNPIFKVMSPLFPDAFSGLSIRYGIARTAGTFEHPILACIMVIVVYRIHRWLTWSGAWTASESGWLGRIQRLTRYVPLTFSTLVAWILIIMAVMTISRGPWIGGIAAAILVAAGNAKNRGRALVFVVLLFVVGAIAGKIALDAYITPKEGQLIAAEAQTMLYRKVMVERYMEFLMERMWVGWGLTDVPTIPGMESVDNAFFLMALQHGILAPALFTIIFLYAILSQIRHGLKSPPGVPPLGFTFAGIYLMCFFAFMTVYMGAQTEPMLFLLLGWGEGIKYRSHRDSTIDDTLNVATPPTSDKPPFRRVLR